MKSVNAAVAAAAVLLLVAPASAAAPADANVEEGKVGISVRGEGPRVDTVGASMDGRVRGAKARLYSVYKGNRYEITRWKRARFTSYGMKDLAWVKWKLHKRFYNGEWLCVEFNKTSGTPCARIHR